MRGTLVRLEPGFLTAPALFILYAAGVSENELSLGNAVNKENMAP
jgi:hypothetical protein